MSTKQEMMQLTMQAMQAMLSSEYVSDFIRDGSAGNGNADSKHEAIAKEAFKYAQALEKEYEESYRRQ